MVSTVLEVSKHFWSAAATPILTTIPIVVMYGCGVSTDDTSIQVKYTILLVSLPTYLLYLTTKFSTDGTLHLCMFNSYQVALMAPFNWLVDSPLMKAEWRSVSMECGGQCVMIAGVPVMPGLCADS